MNLDNQTIAKVLTANYAAAAELLAAAAKEMAEAVAAAEQQQTNLAIGTALGAEAATKKALTLIQAASIIRASHT